MNKALTLILVFAAAAFSFSGKYHQSLLLDMPENNNAAAVGMGSLMVLPPFGASNAALSPAHITDKAGIFGSASLGLSQNSEQRETPLYDNFESMVGWTAYANNKKTYALPSVFAGYSLKGEWSGAIAVGYAPLMSAEYKYEEEVRDDSGNLTGTNFLESEGTLAGPAIAASAKLSHWGYIGLGVLMASGTLETRRSALDETTLMPYEEAFLTDSASTDITATVLTVDLMATPSDRWEIGLKYTPKTSLDENTPYPPDLPGRFGFGFAFKPTGHAPSRVVFETEHVAWADLGDDDSSYQSLENEWTFRFGIEHKLPNGTTMRAGAFHYVIPVYNPVARTGISIGGGFGIFDHTTLDLSAGYLMSKYEMHPLFTAAPDDTTLVPYDRVRESSFYGRMAVNVEF